MRKGIIGAFSAVFIMGASLVQAQQAASVLGGPSDNGRLSQTEFKMLTDTRIEMIEAALHLTQRRFQWV